MRAPPLNWLDSGDMNIMNYKKRKIDAKFFKALENSEFDAVIAIGSNNFTYMTGTVLPYAPNYPDRKALAVRTKGRQECIICPLDWEKSIRDQNWNGEIRTYSECNALPPLSIVNSLVELLFALNLKEAKIGIEFSKVTSLFMEMLMKRMTKAIWLPCDSLFMDLRRIKTKSEIALLENASKQSEMAIIGALNHMEGSMDGTGYTLSEFTERLRVHAYEAGASGVGHLVTLQGADSQRLHAPQHGKFIAGNLIRMVITNHLWGYWSNASRIAFIGEAKDAYNDSYQNNVFLKSAAEDMLKPGHRCDEVFKKVKDIADKKGIEFWKEVGIGHGVGLDEREAPFLTSHDRSILQPGMVIVLAVCTYGPNREIICSKDAYEITGDGCRLLSWYRNWNRLYETTGFRSAH
jgi:Xaa-Pro aminopeptidase